MSKYVKFFIEGLIGNFPQFIPMHPYSFQRNLPKCLSKNSVENIFKTIINFSLINNKKILNYFLRPMTKIFRQIFKYFTNFPLIW